MRAHVRLYAKFCFTGLNYSMQQRNIQYLESAIYETKNKNFADDLKTELLQAEMMLANLKKIEVTYGCLIHILHVLTAETHCAYKTNTEYLKFRGRGITKMQQSN